LAKSRCGNTGGNIRKNSAPTCDSREVLRRERDRLHEWWRGTPYKNAPGTRVFFVGSTLHWTARWAHNVVDYLREHHRWVIGTAVAIAALIFAKMR
jgi:hypothetical protein